MATSHSPVLGIDFGTSTTYLAKRAPGDTAEIVAIGDSERYMPSLAGLRAGALVIGEPAGFMPPDQVVRSAKRAITEGRTSFAVASADGQARLPRDEVIVALLREAAKRGRARGEPLDARQIRFGCPAMWTGPERRLIIDLADRAGLPVSMDSLIEEPVAAGLAWLAGQRRLDPASVRGRLLVFDMGGGTLDIAVIDVAGGPPPSVTVLTSVGIPMAGDSLDDLIAADLRAELSSQGVDLAGLSRPDNAENELSRLARDVKVSLSAVLSHSVLFSRRFFDGAKISIIRYHRERLEEVFRPQLAVAEQLVWQALRYARITHHRGSSTQAIGRVPAGELARDVDYVLLAGGMSMIPMIRARLRELFPGAQVFTSADGVDPAETVVSGLTDTLDVNTMNIYRPAFDLAVAWENGTRRLALYDAYTPLFGAGDISSGRSALGFEATAGERQGLPRQRSGELRVRTAAGDPVRLLRAGEELAALPVRFGHQDVRLKVYCDGRVLVTDGVGHSHEVRVDGWPPVVGRDTRPEPAPVPDPASRYPFDDR